MTPRASAPKSDDLITHSLIGFLCLSKPRDTAAPGPDFQIFILPRFPSEKTVEKRAPGDAM
jgi:hypothetical protein